MNLKDDLLRTRTAELFDYLRSKAPPRQEISTLSPFEQPDIEKVRKTVVKLNGQLKALSPDQRDSWVLRHLGDGINQFRNSKGDQIANVVLLMAEIWEEVYEKRPTSHSDAAKFYNYCCEWIPTELMVSPRALFGVLEELRREREEAARKKS